MLRGILLWLLLVSPASALPLFYVEHDFSVPVSDFYNFSFSAGGTGFLSQQLLPLDGDAFTFLVTSSPSLQQLAADLTAAPGLSVTMTINSASTNIPLTANLLGQHIANFSVGVHGFESPTTADFNVSVVGGVPEPSTLLLAPFALVLAWRFRQRDK